LEDKIIPHAMTNSAKDHTDISEHVQLNPLGRHISIYGDRWVVCDVRWVVCLVVGVGDHAVRWCRAVLLNSSTSESSLRSGSSSSWRSLSSVDSWWKPTPLRLWDSKWPRLRRRERDVRLTPKHGNLP